MRLLETRYCGRVDCSDSRSRNVSSPLSSEELESPSLGSDDSSDDDRERASHDDSENTSSVSSTPFDSVIFIRAGELYRYIVHGQKWTVI